MRKLEVKIQMQIGIQNIIASKQLEPRPEIIEISQFTRALLKQMK